MSALAPSKITVDLAAYQENIKLIRKIIPNECSVMAVVKAEAYGLGAVPLGQRAVAAGAKVLGVATVQEGITLREAGIEAPIAVLLHPSIDVLEAALDNNLILTIGDVPTAERLGDVARSQRKVAVIYCEIDTGMGRQGFSTEEAVKNLLMITRVSNVDIEGLCTHFPSAEDPNDAFTDNQIKVFRQLLREMDDEGVPFGVAHAANSAAIVNYPQSCWDIVRPGLMTYGVWPGDGNNPESGLKPVLAWTSQIVQIRELAGGMSVGYGRTYKAPTPAKMAIVPVGYADGYAHGLSNNGDVLVRGVRCKIRGCISMDQFVADVSGVANVSVGDTVTLIGTDGSLSITVEEVAKAAGTIPYEIMTGIGPRVAREYQG